MLRKAKAEADVKEGGGSDVHFEKKRHIRIIMTHSGQCAVCTCV